MQSKIAKIKYVLNRNIYILQHKYVIFMLSKIEKCYVHDMKFTDIRKYTKKIEIPHSKWSQKVILTLDI